MLHPCHFMTGEWGSLLSIPIHTRPYPFQDRGGLLSMGPMWDYNEAFGLCCGFPITVRLCVWGEFGLCRGRPINRNCSDLPTSSCTMHRYAPCMSRDQRQTTKYISLPACRRVGTGAGSAMGQVEGVRSRPRGGGSTYARSANAVLLIPSTASLHGTGLHGR